MKKDDDMGTTSDRNDPDLRVTDSAGMQKAYLVLSESERKEGFVRPVRNSYIHNVCDVVTTMGTALSETYARDPYFYSGTYCAGCRDHFPVGAGGDFAWSQPRADTPLGMQDMVGT